MTLISVKLDDQHLHRTDRLENAAALAARGYAVVLLEELSTEDWEWLRTRIAEITARAAVAPLN